MIESASVVERAELQQGPYISPGNKENACAEEQVQADWTNFKSLLLKEGAFHLFNNGRNSDHFESDGGASELETAPSLGVKMPDDQTTKKSKKNSVGQVQEYHLDQVCRWFNLNKKQVSNLDVFCCKHIEKRHRAKFMCHSCYHQKGNTKKAVACEHSDRPHYSQGLCKNCYLKDFYNKRQAK